MEILGAEKLSHYTITARGLCYMSFVPDRGRFSFSVKMMKQLGINLDTKVLIGIFDMKYYLLISKVTLSENKPLSLVSHGKKAIGFSSVLLSERFCKLFDIDNKSKKIIHLFVEISSREVEPGMFAHLITKEI